MDKRPHPTERELGILRVLWARGEATVRQVYEVLREDLPIVQNTVQAMLRSMEEKGLVTHRVQGRSFIYRPVEERKDTAARLLKRVLERAFDGSIDQLVKSAVFLRRPTWEEIESVRSLLAELESEADSECPTEGVSPGPEAGMEP